MGAVTSDAVRKLSSDSVTDLATDAPKRADARRNIAAILDAATICLAAEPDCSVGDIAVAAGVGRVTLYGHFESRAALVDAVVTRAVADTDAALDAIDLDGDPRLALARLIRATWQLTDRFGSLVVAAERVLSPERMYEVHAGPMQRVQRLIAWGQREGAFRGDLPDVWLVASLHGLIHAAAMAVASGELSTRDAPEFINATVQAASPRPLPRFKPESRKRDAVRSRSRAGSRRLPACVYSSPTAVTAKPASWREARTSASVWKYCRCCSLNGSPSRGCVSSIVVSQVRAPGSTMLLITKSFPADVPATLGLEMVKFIIASVWRSKTNHPAGRSRRATEAIVSRSSSGVR